MDRSRVRTWVVAGSVTAAAALVSPSAQAQVAVGRFQVQLVIQKSCTVTPGAQAGAGPRASAPVSVSCSGNTPYSIETAPADGDGTIGAGDRSVQPYSRDVSAPSAAGTKKRTLIVTVHY